MSDQEGDSSPLDEPCWGIWQGFRAFREGSDTTSVPGLRTNQENTESAKDESERVYKALAFSNTGRKKCRVPGCRVTDCKLASHQLYRSEVSARTRSKRKQGATVSGALKHFELFNKPPELSQDTLDGFPPLPMQESSDPAMQSLLHYFFCDIFDRLSLLFRGPALSDLAQFKGRMLGTALSSEVYCRSLILHSRIQQDLMAVNVGETKEALKLYSGTIRAFRSQLHSIHKQPNPVQIELALLVLCTLMVYDGAHDHAEAQRVHWQGMKDLVSLRGGMHCVTVALPYVIHADRGCAVLFGEAPTYTNPLAQSFPMPIPSPSSARYGLRFREMKESLSRIDETVLNYCIEIGGLIELWEESQIKAITKHNRPSKYSSEYVHYVRDRLDEQFAILNAQWSRIHTRDRCVLWATRLVEYTCTWSSYATYMTRHLSRQIAGALQQQDMATLWLQDSDLLLWVMFVLATVESTSELRAWVLASIRQMLTIPYGPCPWPKTWWIGEQKNLLEFVWSNSLYAGKFKKICNELERL